MRSHMEHHPGIKNVEEWKFVSQNLDKIAEAAIGSIVKDIAKEYSYANPPNKQPLQNGSPSYYSMVTSTYYTRCLSALVNMTISELRTSDFFFDNNDIKIKKVHGFNLSEFLPFVIATEPKHTTQPLDKNLIGSKRFDTDFKCLFTSQNLQVMYSYFLVPVNVWDGKKIINKLLDKVVLVLLRHHLARNRESKRISTTTIRKLPGKKDMRNNGRYKISQMLNDRQEVSAEHKLVVQNLNIAEEQQVFLEDESTLDYDVPERRLNQLESIIKHLVFSNYTPIYLEDVRHQSPETSTAEQSVCSLICSTLKKSLPPKKQYHLLIQNMDQENLEEPSSHTNQQEKKGYNRDDLIGPQDKSHQNEDATFNAVFDMGEI
ncbi:hypothetical protein J3Q64DRAFT_1861078 [Phycomyces blakesleeanus]|uniref:Uncharacterized protein n=1 Tax=Phycomyces blakesleeanus TaxID=4837 RepID=A0ABR3AX45_PHYBL